MGEGEGMRVEGKRGGSEEGGMGRMREMRKGEEMLKENLSKGVQGGGREEVCEMSRKGRGEVSEKMSGSESREGWRLSDMREERGDRGEGGG